MNNKKKITFCIVNIFFLFVNVYLTGFTNSILLGKKFNIDFISNLNTILEYKKCIYIFVLLQVLYGIFTFYVLCLLKSNIYKTDSNLIAGIINTPKSIESGQYGTAKWMKEKEFKNIYSKNTLMIDKDLKKQKFKNAGLVVGVESCKNKEDIYYISENTHSLVIGATRSGKTRSVVLQTICNIGMSGQSLIISDPKGELFYYTSEFLRNLDYEIVTIDFRNPIKSSRYNFLQPVIDALKLNDLKKAEEMVWNITYSIVEDNKKVEKIWRDGEASVIAGTIMAVCYENMDNPMVQNLTNVYAFISEMCKSDNGYMPLNDYINTLNNYHPAKKLFNICLIAPERTRASFFTSALTTLRLFTTKNMYNMTFRSDFDLEETGNKKRVIYMILNDESKVYYSLASLFINQQYIALIDSATKNGGELNNAVNFILDEFGNFATINNFLGMLTVAGSRRIRINLFLQSFSQLEEKYSKEEMTAILDNTAVWVYLKTSNVETAEKISKRLGIYTTSSYAESSSFSKNQGSNTNSYNLISRNLLNADEIIRIKRPYGIIMQMGYNPAIRKLNDISKQYFNKLLDMGNENKNRELRLKREKMRKENELYEIEYWNIWEDYI